MPAVFACNLVNVMSVEFTFETRLMSLSLSFVMSTCEWISLASRRMCLMTEADEMRDAQAAQNLQTCKLALNL